MARTVAQIQAQIIAAKDAQADLASLTSTSTRAIWRVYTFIIAASIAVLEQLMDLYQSVIETLVSRSPGASTLWVQDKMFKFQYDATDPQIVQLIETIPQYPVVNAAKRIITACAVVTDVNNTVNIKVAKSNPYEALDGSQLSAAQSYIDTIGIAGITYDVISLDADKLFIEAEVFYRGQYSAVIQGLVITALNDYMQTLSLVNFNGSLKMSDLEAVIRNVTGVSDVVMKNVRVRPDTTAFASSTYYIQNATLINRLVNPAAGYMIQETDTGHTFADSLTFTAV